MKKVLFAACLLAVVPAWADDPPKDKPPAEKPKKLPVETFTDPEKAGPDFKIQGEYSFPPEPDKKPGAKEVSKSSGKFSFPTITFGAQVIAEGDGKFSVRLLGGGLPGDGWDGKTQFKGSAKTVNGKVAFEIMMPDGKPVKGEIGSDKFADEFVRIVRHSPTEGMKPPPGALVLFDGTNADAWDHGKIENGLLSVKVPDGQTSKQKFTDCTVHVEFMLPFMPRARGQDRANSGVYLQGRYEVQVLDSFGLAGKNNECGGIYELSDPLVNMCYPPLQWQTFDIDYVAPRFDSTGKKTDDARMTVKHNGVLVQDNVKIKRDTRSALNKEGPGAGPIHLQNHGNPVMYRNIWVVEKK